MVTPIAFDLLYKGSPQPGQLTYPALALTCLQDQPGAAALFPQTALYVAPIVADPWASSTVLAAGTYATCANPNVFTGGVNRHVYVYSGGTTGTTEPAWNMTPGGTTVDGSGTWTECSLLFGAGTMTGCEPIDVNYARAPLDNSGLIFYQDTVTPNPTISFPVSATAYGNVVGLFVSDAPTGGNIHAWGLFPAAYVPAVGTSLTIPLGPTAAPAPPSPHAMAVSLVQSDTVDFNPSSSASAQTVTLNGVMAGDTLVMAVPVYGTPTAPTVSSVTSTGSPTWTKINSAGVSTLDLEWWYATGVPAGTNVVTVTPTGSSRFGLWIGELSNAGTPVTGMTDTGGSTQVGYTAMTVGTPGSWVAVASFTISPESNSVGLGSFNAGPYFTGGQQAGLTYGAASANTPAAVGWVIPSAVNWLTAGIVVPPA